jgi:hypothetical protein
MPENNQQPRVPWKLINAVRGLAAEGGPTTPEDVGRAYLAWKRGTEEGTGMEGAVQLAALFIRLAWEADREHWDKVPSQAEWAKKLVDLHMEPDEGCPHLVVLPAGRGMGKCHACGAEDFPLTPEAAGVCPGCGGFEGCCGTVCSGAVLQPWALAKQSLARIRGMEGLLDTSPQARTMFIQLAPVVRDLRRIAGELLVVTVPGVSSFRAEYEEDAETGKAWPIEAWWGLFEDDAGRAWMTGLGLEPVDGYPKVEGSWVKATLKGKK